MAKNKAGIVSKGTQMFSIPMDEAGIDFMNKLSFYANMDVFGFSRRYRSKNRQEKGLNQRDVTRDKADWAAVYFEYKPGAHPNHTALDRTVKWLERMLKRERNESNEFQMKADELEVKFKSSEALSHTLRQTHTNQIKLLKEMLSKYQNASFFELIAIWFLHRKAVRVMKKNRSKPMVPGEVYRSSPDGIEGPLGATGICYPGMYPHERPQVK